MAAKQPMQQQENKESAIKNPDVSEKLPK